jgi:ribosomal protein L7/L12
MIITEDLERQIKLLLSQNRKIEAIKLVVDATHCGLKNAKDYIDNFESGKGNVSAEPVFEKDLDAKLLRLLADGDKLGAVKLYKDTTGLGLAESKDYVDGLQERGFAVTSGSLPSQNISPTSKKRDTQIDDLLNDQNTKPKSGCFVATVCYGDYDADEVMVLRQFRDEYLMQSFAGKAFVQFYYAISPFLAKQIDKSFRLKRAIRKHVLNPIVNRLSQSAMRN